MNIRIDIDCTPEEARTFLGLPDVSRLQETMTAEIEKRMRANIEAMDPETLMKAWLPGGMQGLEQVQKAFWAQMMGGADKSGGKKQDQ